MTNSTKKQPTIGIVGAGPGGLSFAQMLLDRGYTDITVLEKDNRVGGKSYTVQDETHAHDLGTCYSTWGYTHSNRWMKRFNLPQIVIPTGPIVCNDHTVKSFKKFVLGQNGFRARLQIVRYMLIWIYYYYLQTFFWTPKLAEELSIPFKDWLENKKLDAMVRGSLKTMVRVGLKVNTHMGYGHLEEISTYHGLNWNRPSHILCGLLSRVKVSVLGWQRLWERISWNLDIRLNISITKACKENGKIVVTSNSGTFTFDHLIVSIPLDKCEWLEIDGPHKYFAEKIYWGEFASSLVKCSEWHDDTHVYSYEENSCPSRNGHLMYYRRTLDKTPTAKSRPNPKVKSYVCYQYCQDLEEEVIKDTLSKDIIEDDALLEEISHLKKWSYCPYIKSEDIKNGNLRRLHSFQGQNNLWFTGSTFSFESIKNIADYNYILSEKLIQSLNPTKNIIRKSINKAIIFFRKLSIRNF